MQLSSMDQLAVLDGDGGAMKKVIVVKMGGAEFLVASDVDGDSVLFPAADILMMVESKAEKLRFDGIPATIPDGSMITMVSLKNGSGALGLNATIEDVLMAAVDLAREREAFNKKWASRS